MEAIVLGSGTGIPSLRRGAPGLAIVLGSQLFLFDGGSGSLVQLLRAGLRYQQVEALFFSHLHPDHTAELVPFLFATKYGFVRERELRLYGPRGFHAFYQSLLPIYGRWILAGSYALLPAEIERSEVTLTAGRVLSQPVFHTVEAVGYRVEDESGKVLAYSGDTDYCPAMVELARGADLAILECSFPNERKVAGHLTPALAGRIAEEAGCARLVLVHLYPVCDEYDIAGQCRQSFSGEVIVAEDLMRFVL